METLYVKTDGPVPEGAKFIRGKPYEVAAETKLTFTVFDEDGVGFIICKFGPCEASSCTIPFFGCDSTGTPVPAPWEKDAIDAPYTPTPDDKAVSSAEFERALSSAVNCHSKENGSDTPDFILANFMASCLSAFDAATKARDNWYMPESKSIPIDYRAHAERLAEALSELYEACDGIRDHIYNHDAVMPRAEAALSAYNQSKEST